MNQRLPKRSRWLRGISPVLALLFPLFLSACSMQTDSFDSDTWKAQRGAKAPDNKRVHMVSALEATVRVGMPRDEVIRLLGEPDSHDPETGTDQYMLGLAWSPDEKYYEIKYQNGVVASLRAAEF